MSLLRALDNREIAVLSWMVVGLLWMLTVREIRSALGSVVHAILQPSILGSISALAAYCFVLAYVGGLAGIWHPGLSKDTIIWFLGVGVVLLSNVGQVPEADRWFRREARKVARVTIFVAFFVNVAVFSIPIELILVPVLTLLGVMSAFTSGKEEFQPAKAFVDGLLAVAGVVLAGYVGVQVASDWASIATVQTAERAALPVWLTLAVLPFVYFVGVFSAYQVAFSAIDTANPAGVRRRALAKAVLAAACRLRARDVGQFRAFEAHALLEAGSLLRMWASIVIFRRGLAEERRAALGTLQT